MEITSAELKERILNAYFNNGLQPQYVSNVKEKAKPYIAFSVSDIIKPGEKLSFKDKTYSFEDETLKEKSLIVIDTFGREEIEKAMRRFKDEKLFEYFSFIGDGNLYKPCDKKGFYENDDDIKKSKQTRKTYNKTIADKELTFIIKRKKSTGIHYDVDYLVSVQNPEGKQVANCEFHIVKGSYCKLGWIEIEDADYIKIGLGSEMLKIAENTAREEGVFHINARIQPFGDFADRTRGFYEKNGFKIEYDPCDRKVYGDKDLPPLESEKEDEDGAELE